MYIVPTNIYKIFASKLMHSFDCFQVVETDPSRYSLLARCDNSPVSILMFIKWLILNTTIQTVATDWFGYLQ